MRTAIITAAVLLIFAGCTKLDYIGEEYPPTSRVDLYFSHDDVQQEYKVMGHVVATAGEFVSSEKMQDDIKKKAMEKGADAIIIEGLTRYQTGESTDYHEETKEKDGKVVTTASSSTSSEEKKEVKAVFIKYL
jgi:hypothetical protein